MANRNGPRRFLTTRIGAIATSAAALAGAAVINQLLARRAERKNPPIGSFVDVDGLPVHYVEQGSGSPVVLVHGSGSLIQDFMTSGLVSLLAQRHRVIVFDRPGYGYTPRPRHTDWTPEAQAKLLSDACTALGVDRPLVVGHSWGTLVAVAWALECPDRVSKIALLSGYYYPTRRPDAVTTAIIGSPVLGDGLVHTVAPLQTRLTGPLGNRMIFSPASPTDAYLQDMPFELMLRPHQLRATAQDSGQMPAAADRLSRRYDRLTLPVTIVWGDGDKLVKQENQSEKLAQQLPHATSLKMEGLGHMLHHNRPQHVAAVIEELAEAGT